MSLCVRGGASLSRRYAERKRHAADIKIHFLHYRSFEEAREKWLERSGRLDFDNLCVVMQAAKLDEGLLERFERLPIPRKVILAYETLPLQSPSIFKMRSLDSFVPGRILDYNGLSGRRYLDDFDYVAVSQRRNDSGAKLPPRRNSAPDSEVWFCR